VAVTRGLIVLVVLLALITGAGCASPAADVATSGLTQPLASPNGFPTGDPVYRGGEIPHKVWHGGHWYYCGKAVAHVPAGNPQPLPAFLTPANVAFRDDPYDDADGPPRPFPVYVWLDGSHPRTIVSPYQLNSSLVYFEFKRRGTPTP
jgi:hypothetical protein